MAAPADAVAVLSGILHGHIDQAPAVAASIIEEFGSLGAALHASPMRLVRVAGATVVLPLAAVRAAIHHVLKEQVVRGPVIGNWVALIDYLRTTLAHAQREQVRLLHLDVRNALIRDEVISEGTVDTAALYVREVIVRCLELGASSLIIVHNHPSGDPTPSRADIEKTRAIMSAAKPLGITVHDHVVIGKTDHVSMRSRGLI